MKTFDATVKRTIKSLAEGIQADMKKVKWKLKNGVKCDNELDLIEKKAGVIAESADKLYEEKKSF